ncbi:MAG TPA: SHOCT domain-containing protein [Actinospica sp.]|nr:SHOCT domain-containing protein [Actinospica sp.]
MDHPLLNAFWIMLWFFIWIMWLILLFRVVVDLFSDHSLSGWAKAGWLIALIVLPYIGVFAYLIARGATMGRREQEKAEASEQAFRDYVRDAAGPSQADELAKLASLKADGTISEREFEQAKSKILA